MAGIISWFIILISSFCFLIAQGIVNGQDTLAQSEGVPEHLVGDHDVGMDMTEGSPVEKAIPQITEWIGVFSLGIFTGLFVFKTNPGAHINNHGNKTRTRTWNIIIAIAILSISVGIIHVLLVPEHSQESLIWGMIFLASGLAQVGFGIVILLVRGNSLTNALYYLGVVGNSVLVITFILVRLVGPPFSPEAAPINELEPNDIISLVIEMVLIVLLAYQLKHKDNTKENIMQI
jgi:hypothetical protein